MKIITILGTRPEIIRLSLVIQHLDRHAEHILVHTGQNYDERLSSILLREMGVRAPDVNMGVRGVGFADQIGQIFTRSEELFREHRPDRLLILGDTNSGLSAIIARRLGIPVYHMEAGNRCYDDRVPEEINRRVIDHSSSILLPYTARSRDNLLREGITGSRIFIIGNPIKEVIDAHAADIAASRALTDLGVEERRYVLVTAHRAENVDNPDRLLALLNAMTRVYKRYGHPVIYSCHPRTRSRMEAYGFSTARNGVRFLEPLRFCDFVRLEQSAFCILSDSGTVQEEACILGVPNVTLRDTTERPETIDCGSNVLAGVDPPRILELVEFVTARAGQWQPPAEYLATNVADVMCRVMLGYMPADAAEREWQRRKSGEPGVTAETAREE